jgi:hypothetical protein
VERSLIPCWAMSKEFRAWKIDEWVVVTPEGFFDASPKGAEMLSVVRGFDVYSIDQTYESLHRLTPAS